MVGWRDRLNGREPEQTPGDGEGQGSLACCSPRVHKESDMTAMNSKDNLFRYFFCSFTLTLGIQLTELDYLILSQGS